MWRVQKDGERAPRVCITEKVGPVANCSEMEVCAGNAVSLLPVRRLALEVDIIVGVSVCA